MYAYSASPDDPNEVSFAKGDMLDVIDGTGKWFQVRAPNGQTGVSLFLYLSSMALMADCPIQLLDLTIVEIT
jgi:SHO1 osmosensor